LSDIGKHSMKKYQGKPRHINEIYKKRGAIVHKTPGILEGQLIIKIGVAMVRPAEFIIIKFSHKMQAS